MQNHKVLSRDEWLAARKTCGFASPRLSQTSGKWTITHQHSSVPFYMNGNFKAAIGLKP